MWPHAVRPFAGSALVLLVVACGPTGPRVKLGTTTATPGAGVVMGLDGKPAAGVLVRGYLISNNGGAIVGQNGASVVSDGGAALVGKTKYRLFQALEARTDAQGRFTLAVPAGAAVNVEAVQADDVKAIALAADGPGALARLQLAYTGTLSGRVTAPENPAVTDFEGVDVFVPGSSYVAKADKGGRFTITNVAVGRFTLVATKAGLGRAEVAGVQVASKATTTAPDLAMAGSGPTLTAVEPLPAAPGATVTLRGKGFGASSGAPFQVTVGGAVVASPTRVDDQTITLTLPTFAPGATVQVAVGGVPSVALPLAALTAVGLADPATTLAVGGMLGGEVLAFDGTALGPFSGAEVKLTGAALARDGAGFKAVAPGEATLEVLAGGVTAKRVVRVVDGGPTFTPFAGFGVEGRADGVAGKALFARPSGVVAAAGGVVYVADKGNHRVCRLAPDGTVSTIAGGAEAGFADGPGAAARFSKPCGLALDGQGGLIVADGGNNRLRRIALADPAHPVTTVAGTGAVGEANGAAAQATFSDLAGVAVDAAGRIYATEWGNQAVRVVTPAGQVSTLAGGGGQFGHVDGPGATARFMYPDGLAVAADGTLYLADGQNHCVRKVAPDGRVSTLAGKGPFGADAGAFADGAGAAAGFWWPRGVALGPDGAVWVGDTGNGALRRVAPDGTVTTVARATTAAGVAYAEVGDPLGLAVGPDGRVWVAMAGRHQIGVYRAR